MHVRLAIAWTMMAAAALAGCASQRGLQVVVEPEPKNSAWWLRATFVPHGDQVRGIPLQRIDPSWCKANELTEWAFPDAIRAGADGLDRSLADGSGGFSTAGIFDGRPLEVVLGIFQACDGRAANFLLVLAADRPASSPEKVVQVATISLQPMMAYVQADPAHGVLYIPFCFACDHVAEWRWHAGSGKFLPQPEPEFE